MSYEPTFGEYRYKKLSCARCRVAKPSTEFDYRVTARAHDSVCRDCREIERVVKENVRVGEEVR